MLLPRNAVERKKTGLIVVGGSPVDNIQYELIRKQFDCMADYLSWICFSKIILCNGKG